MAERTYDLEQRLIVFAGMAISVTEKLPKNLAAKHLGGQLVRSGTSPALNSAEAVGAESKPDFIHKMGVPLMLDTTPPLMYRPRLGHNKRIVSLKKIISIHNARAYIFPNQNRLISSKTLQFVA